MESNVYQDGFIQDMTREEYGFSYEGAKLLFDHLEQLEDHCNTIVEYDPIAFRCEYTEYCIGDYINDFGLGLEFETYIKDYSLEGDDLNTQYNEYFDDYIYNHDRYIRGDKNCFIITNH